MSFIPNESNPYVQFGPSMNEMFLELLSPFSYMGTLAVQVVSPLIPDFVEPLPTQPDYELSDFLVWGKPFEEYLNDGEDSFLYPLYYALTELAKIRVRWELIGHERIWKQLVSLYACHYLELHLQILKDEANRLSLNPYEKDKDYKYVMEVGGEVQDDFKMTHFGRMFWFIYKPYGQFSHWGINY